MSKKPKKAQKPSQRLPDIIAALEQNPDGMSTGELASALGLSTSHAREILSSEVKRGNLKRTEVDDQGTTVFKFFNVEHRDELDDLMATGDEEATRAQVDGAPDLKKRKEAKRARSPGPLSGRGHPEAKKAINPQQTLEDKKAITKELGGTMSWAGRRWHMKGPNFDVSMTSREIASFSLEQFRRKLE
jgi:hypothetical protein